MVVVRAVVVVAAVFDGGGGAVVSEDAAVAVTSDVITPAELVVDPSGGCAGWLAPHATAIIESAKPTVSAVRSRFRTCISAPIIDDMGVEPKGKAVT